MHQDVYSRYFCCDGAPEWAIRDDGLPFEQLPQWDLNYFTKAVMASFDNFWNYAGPHSDLQDHYADAWAAVAERFKDHPAVIGYDLMNEPSPGSALDAAEFSHNPPADRPPISIGRSSPSSTNA
jgi:endoglycosylceramidase